MLSSLSFLLALLFALLMGLAIQRGSTCMVAAVEQALQRKRPTKLAAILEASLWAGTALLILRELGRQVQIPSGYPVTGTLALGAVLLGLGAFTNRACLFGTVARLGSGEWAYAATPLGYFLGCLAGAYFLPSAYPAAFQQSPPLFLAPSALVWVLGCAVALRIVWVLFKPRERVWSPHAATATIAIAFVAMVLLAGAWSYSDVIADLAHGMAHSVGWRAGLALAMLAGAFGSGWVAGLWRPKMPTPSTVLRCLGGGFLMGYASLLIPGGNDVLLLIGMPLLWPYAWLAFAIMGTTIAAAVAIERLTKEDRQRESAETLE